METFDTKFYANEDLAYQATKGCLKSDSFTLKGVKLTEFSKQYINKNK